MFAAFLLTFLQAPGRTVADTKYDLAQNPLGFLSRAAHLWSSQAPMGQVQNQAYGYFFPHGAFFSLGHWLGLPAWVTQRIWWALLLLAGFWGIVRLCEALGIGSRGSRVIAATAFALSPRVLTTLGSISSETLPMMLAPWVLLAPAALGTALARGRTATAGQPAPGERDGRTPDGNPRRGAPSAPWRGATTPAASAFALALMGSVNAVATAAAFLPAALWWASCKPNPLWWRFTRAWIPLLVLATFWWAVPLLLLGRVSPPFLDYIESAGVTTQWASLAEVLRGTDSWTPFVSPERIAGAVLVTQPAAVLATGMIAAAGMAGLALRSMPGRGRFVLILCVGLVGICAGYAGQLGGPFAEQVRLFLDSGGAPLRNVHKLEPLIRIPLVVGLAHLLSRVPLPASVPMPVWRKAFAHPERDRMVAVTALVLAALALSTSLAWTGKLAPRGAYDEVPGYWKQTAEWLAHNASETRALVVPGAPFGSQVWGLTRDEPLQALASTPWAVRDAVPLNPPGAIRAMDSVQRLIADGRPSAGLAPTLAEQGIGVLVLRNDLDPETSRSTQPMLAHRAIEGSPGLTKVAEFGDPVDTNGKDDGLVADGDLRPSYPAVEIYRVQQRQVGTPAEIHSGTGAPESFPGAYAVPLDSVPVVQGGPEVLERLARDPAVPAGPTLLAADAERAGLPIEAVTVTDTPMARETDFGRVDNHSSAVRADGDPRRTYNLVPDYPVPGAQLVRGQWSGATITASSAAGDATQLGGAAPGSSTAAAVDGDPATGWLSNGTQPAIGQWLRLDLDEPIDAGALRVTTSRAAIGSPVKWLEVATARGTVSARVAEPGTPVNISLPPGRTQWVKITARQTQNGSGGGQFGISELTLDDYSRRDDPVRVDIQHRVVLPPTPVGARIDGWRLGQEFPGRSACFDTPDRIRCSKALALAAEEPGVFERLLSVPEPLAVAPELMVRTRPGPALERLLSDPNRPIARGRADVADPRGAAVAATDGDPRTSWVAPETTVRNILGPKPTLVIELSEPTLVTGLDLTPSPGELPAHPTSVSVNLGDGPQIREVDADSGVTSRVDLHPHVTDRVELSIHTWDTVLDRTALGFAQEQPPGLAEVAVLGPDYPAAGDPGTPITVDCADGPTIAVAGRTLHTSVTGTIDELRSGAPLPARLCTPEEVTAAAPDLTVDDDWDRNGGDLVGLPAGQVDVTVAPTELFTVDELRLHRAALGGSFTPATTETAPQPAADPARTFDDGARPAEERAPQPTNNAAPQPTDNTAPQQGPDGGATIAPSAPPSAFAAPVGVRAAPDTRLLVLPLSTNVGWEAHTADGTALEPVVIDGWQQAWLIPADSEGPVTVSFPADRWYRLAIFGGLVLLVPLAVLALRGSLSRRVRALRNPGTGTAEPHADDADEPHSDATAEPHTGAAAEPHSETDARAITTHPAAPRTWRSRTVGALGITAAAGLISGPVGIALGATALIADQLRPRHWDRILVALAAGGTAVSAAALSTGPWRSPEDYMGGSLWTQFPALVAVIAVAVAALPPRSPS
ncbi:alpha-(1-_3)-arabinofuranosyltransferase family protein [Nocardia sp. CC227C]|uniref:alpha-(1->3)-arabinofuranosyltransferase domain-containing protein n=1 Tax=Nocardia sp. CC227C TaxID=3044562 RepID=UPI003558291F